MQTNASSIPVRDEAVVVGSVRRFPPSANAKDGVVAKKYQKKPLEFLSEYDVDDEVDAGIYRD